MVLKSLMHKASQSWLSISCRRCVHYLVFCLFREFFNTLQLYLFRKLTKTSSTTAFSSLRLVQSRLPRIRRWWFCSLTGCSLKVTTISSSFCSTARGTPSCKFKHSHLLNDSFLLLYLLLVWRWRLSLKCASTGPIWPKIRFESWRVSMRTIVWRSCRPLGSM